MSEVLDSISMLDLIAKANGPGAPQYYRDLEYFDGEGEGWRFKRQEDRRKFELVGDRGVASDRFSVSTMVDIALYRRLPRVMSGDLMKLLLAVLDGKVTKVGPYGLALFMDHAIRGISKRPIDIDDTRLASYICDYIEGKYING